MSVESSESVTGSQSRRGFLAKLGLGVAAVSLPFTLGRRDSDSTAAAAAQEFPGEDSIFHPAQDPRTDPRRTRSS
ncbi:MAG: hypothetical protein VX947_01175 [Chloroflexota bacterium]|nr:hypothetical protein [Chloroflexota bacterium]